ncbi:MAG: hypothetical protein V1736_06395 [Pseudomonadota bacterium]
MCLRRNTLGVLLLLLLSCPVLLTACSTLKLSALTEGMAAEPAAQPEAGPSSKYYDFDDVLIPPGLDFDAAKSTVINTSVFTGGALVLSGRLDPAFLADFFVNNMAKDNWQLKTMVKYSSTILTFEKPNKGCVITIDPGTFNTVVRVWVMVAKETHKTPVVIPNQPAS